MTIPTIMSGIQLMYDSSSPAWHGEPEYHYFQSAGAKWTLRTSQPVVMSECSPDFDRIEDVSYFRSNSRTSPLRDSAEPYKRFVGMNVGSTNSRLWASMPQEATSLVGLFIEVWVGGATKYVACSVSSFWRTTVTSMYPSDMGYLVESEWPRSSKEALFDATLTPIILDSEGMSSLHSQELWEYVSPDSTRIATIFMDALSRFHGDGNSGFMVTNGSANMSIRYDSPAMNDLTSQTRIKIEGTITGFGFSSTETTTQISLAVIVVYCLIGILYVAYIFTTVHTSIAWNCATELIMLALRSKEPNDLGHVSVGLESMDTLRQSVGIRVHAVNIGETEEVEEKLELAFEHDDDGKRMLTKVERNKAY